MPEQHIILANGSRLVHEMLNRILLNTENLENEIYDKYPNMNRIFIEVEGMKG